MSDRALNRPLTVVALMLSVFMAAMEVTVVSTAMPSVVGQLGGVSLYAWVFTAYILVATIGIPVFGKLADLYGRKPVMLFGIALFLVGSVLCGAAGSIHSLIGARAVQGLGGGAMQATALTIVGDIFTTRERARMQGVIGGVWGVAGLVGPLLGGIIVHGIGWRWVFFINLPFGVISGLMLIAFLHERFEKKPVRLDVLGALLLGTGLFCLLLGARGEMAWLVPVGLLLFCAFVWVELRASEPVLPLDMFKNRVLAVASAAGALVGGALMSATTFVPLFVQGVLGGTPTQAGAAIAPMAVAWPLASAVGGRMIPRFGFRPLVRVGLAIHVLGAVLLAVYLTEGASTTTPGIAMAVFGMGLGFANTALLIAVQSSVEWNRRGVATSSTLLFRTVGGTLAVGMLGELMARSLMDAHLTEDAAKLLAGPVGGAALDAEHAARLASGLASALGSVYWVIAAFSFAAFLLGLVFPRLAMEPDVSGANAGNLDAGSRADHQLAQPGEPLPVDDGRK
jgi:EmrB/QacA subfamily drug resistance transporter